MKQRVESLVKPKAFHYIHGDCDLPHVECARYTALLESQAIDLCCLGVGENGHLAFNDPHVARLDDSEWVKLVRLDDACKMQQVKEGHFPSLETVPPYAFTLTLPALMTARKVVCVAPEKRKAVPVKNAPGTGEFTLSGLDASTQPGGCAAHRHRFRLTALSYAYPGPRSRYRSCGRRRQ